MDVLAEGVHGLSVGSKMWFFKVNVPFFLKGLFTKTKGPYVTIFFDVDICVGMLIPQENLSFALSPVGNHIIYKKAMPEMFGEADCLRLEMKNKYCLDSSQVLAHDSTCQLIRSMTKAMNKKFWCDDGDSQIIELPIQCRGSIHKKFPTYPTSNQIQNAQKQYQMIMTCRIECAFQKNCRKRKAKVVVYDDGDVLISFEEDFDGDDNVDDGDGANADVAMSYLPPPN